jgi:excinuclease ABC subunit A
MPDYIEIKNARTHNLKNISVKIPVNKITVFAGPSGSGKTSLAVHTLYAESKRRFINSMSDGSKFLWQLPSNIEVDSIYPIFPTWCLMQRNPIIGSRQNVADLMGLSERLEKIFFALGSTYCPKHSELLSSSNLQKWLIELCQRFPEQRAYFFWKQETTNLEDTLTLQSIYFLNLTNNERSTVRESEFEEFFKAKLQDPKELETRMKAILKGKTQLEIKVLINAEVLSFFHDSYLNCFRCDYTSSLKLDSWHDLSSYRASSACQTCQGYGMKLVYDRQKLVKNPTLSLSEGCINFLTYKPFEHFYPAMIKALKKNGFDIKLPFSKLEDTKWKILYEGHGDYPGFHSLFSYLESKKYKKNVRIYLRSMQSEVLCEDCVGTRVDSKLRALGIYTKEKVVFYPDVLKMDISSLHFFLKSINLNKSEVVEKLVSSSLEILDSALEFNLGDISLARKAKTLASGEYQKILLLKYISHQGSGSLFILDEPSLGLSQNEQKVLLKNLQKLKKQNNTIILIEHNSYFLKNADELILFGPKAGHLGGEIVYQGNKLTTPRRNVFIKEEIKEESLISIDEAKILHIHRANIRLSKNNFHLVRGDSGSGRGLVFTQLIYNEVKKFLGEVSSSVFAYEVKNVVIDGSLENIEVFDHASSSYTSRSTFGTYTELAKVLRSHFVKLPVSKMLNLQEGHFSANSTLGQCLTCGGQGVKHVEMAMIENMELTCEDCYGHKLKPIYSSISDGEHSFHEANQQPISILKDKIIHTPKFKKLYQYLELLKLDYLSLDRKVSSLSGGEVQRLRLLDILMNVKGESLLIFKNLSYGLSEYELYDLLVFLHKLTKQNFTIVVIDNHELLPVFAHKIIDFSVT